jgi:hypothetical protein
MNRSRKQFTQDGIVILVGISCGLLCFTLVNTLWSNATPIKAAQPQAEKRLDINS